MKDELILKKAIEKAGTDEDKMLLEITGATALLCNNGHYGIIFRHDFAKAFFKDSKTRWDIHLQRMVVYSNPLDYLKRFIEGELI